MGEKHLTENYSQETGCAVKKQNGTKFNQTVSVVILPFVWIGYFYSLYRGNTGNVNSYAMIIVMFSLMNAEVLFCKGKMENKILNALSKVEGILIIVLAFITILNLL